MEPRKGKLKGNYALSYALTLFLRRPTVSLCSKTTLAATNMAALESIFSRVTVTTAGFTVGEVTILTAISARPRLSVGALRHAGATRMPEGEGAWCFRRPCRRTMSQAWTSAKALKRLLATRLAKASPLNEGGWDQPSAVPQPNLLRPISSPGLSAAIDECEGEIMAAL